MIDYSVDKIPVDYFFTEPVLLDSSYVLASPEMSMTEDFIAILKAWHIKSVHSNGSPQDSYVGAVKTVKRDVLSTLNDTGKLRDAEDFYSEFQKFTNDLFSRASVRHKINFDTVAEKIKDVCEEIKKNRRYLLQVQKNIAANDESFLASHAVKSTVIAIIIGIYLKLPVHRLIELGVAALVHEVGMVKLPSSIYLNKGELTQKQRETIFLHPNLGFDILKSSDFPMSVCAAALEHHERENGNGYPRHISGERISIYGKIIAVACSYEAITAKRPHKEAQEAYVGITDLLRNEGKQYDDSVLRALVFSLSVYPIGQFVLLSNGKKAQVVDVNPNDPRYPIVQVLDEQTPDGKNKILETEPGGVHIEKPLEKIDV
ncbi:MAG: HD-GYP domain-containing protein [Spirochaetaceae bacterium]|jgi:HD-GYP domain-containing protein (c-di-GMP phosphodiesterase class II)|nr:HD-GYP domain-containing protein [Spirochaetaceae bacterium]